MKSFIVSVAALIGVAAGPAFACDEQEAVDLMVKISTALGEKAGTAKTEEDSQKIAAANAKMRESADALSAGNPDKACEIYRAVAKEEGIALQ